MPHHTILIASADEHQRAPQVHLDADGHTAYCADNVSRGRSIEHLRLVGPVGSPP